MEKYPGSLQNLVEWNYFTTNSSGPGNAILQPIYRKISKCQSFGFFKWKRCSVVVARFGILQPSKESVKYGKNYWWAIPKAISQYLYRARKITRDRPLHCSSNCFVLLQWKSRCARWQCISFFKSNIQYWNSD